MEIIWAPHAGYSDPSRRWYNPNRYGRDIEGIVWHHTVGWDEGDLRTVRGQTSRQVSVHYYITNGLGEPGGKPRLFQILKETDGGWHVLSDVMWRGEQQVNNRTIGIELEFLSGQNPFTTAQRELAIELGRVLMARYKLKVGDNVRHRDIQAGKSDPADSWNWTDFLERLGEEEVTDADKQDIIRGVVLTLAELSAGSNPGTPDLFTPEQWATVSKYTHKALKEQTAGGGPDVDAIATAVANKIAERLKA